MANIQEAIQYAKLNPNTEFATELRKRIESGQMNNELQSAGLTQYLPKPTVMDTVKDYATQAVTNPVETAKGVIKGIPGQASELTKLVEAPGKYITGKIAEATGMQTPQGLDYTAVEELTKPSNKAQQVGYVASGVLPVERAVGGTELAFNVLKGTTKGTKTAFEAVTDLSKTGTNNLATKAVDFISADPEKKVQTILKESTPQELDNYLSIAEKASSDPRVATPFEVVGDKLSDITKILETKLKEIGKAKSEIIEPTREGLGAFKKETTPLIEKLTSLKNNFSEVDKGQKATVQAIINDAKTVATKRDADMFIDKVQNALYTGNMDMTIPRGSSLDKQLRGIIGEYNSSLKKSLPKEYSQLNEQYSKLIDSLDTINRSLGEVVDGVPVRGASLIKQFFSPSGTKAKEIFDFVKKETNGQVDLAKDSTLAKFSMDLFDDPRSRSLLQGIGDIPTTFGGAATKIVEKLGGEKLQGYMRESTIKKAKKITK